MEISPEPNHAPSIRTNANKFAPASTTAIFIFASKEIAFSFAAAIECLIEVCEHEPEQAEQCALFIHTKGKYAVKNGDYDILKPMCDSITDRGINATVEQVTAK